MCRCPWSGLCEEDRLCLIDVAFVSRDIFIVVSQIYCIAVLLARKSGGHFFVMSH